MRRIAAIVSAYTGAQTSAKPGRMYLALEIRSSIILKCLVPSYTVGSLSVTPEVQYQYTQPITKLGIDHGVSNLVTALFGDYAFGTSSWSFGGFIEYATQFYNKNGTYTTSLDFFGFGPGSNQVGVSITPTWQYKNIFVRADAGFIHVNRGSGGVTLGASGTKPNQFNELLEAGLLF